MDLQEYCKRIKSSKSYKEKCALYQELAQSDNYHRKLFSQQRESWVVPDLEDPFLSLIPVFDHTDIFKCLDELPEEKALPKVFELGAQRKPPGESSIVSQPCFHRNFNELFTEGSLKYMDWTGVFAAGGSVMACLQPLPKKHDVSNRARRRYMHDEGFPGSDVDLFLHGMDAEQAKKKIVDIYEAVCEAVPFNVLCFRSAHAITLVSEYPFRHIQIVLRLYSSPLEVLAGFDVDSCAVGYDGSQVWVTQRCHLALVSQRNPVNLTRRSPTYEMRLAKYAKRGFEVPVPELQRDRVDPTLFERPWNKVVGLAKLLLLERLGTPEERFRYREQHRTKKMQNMYTSAFAMRFGMRGMLRNPWMASRMENVIPTRQGAEASDYSTVFLPWGKGYNAQKCRNLMVAKDKVLNDPYVSKGRQYKLHPCFIGTAEEVIKDCAPKDPPLPDDVDKKDIEAYVRGVLTFIEDDPGRQMIGSFHPIESGNWSDGAYISVEMDSLFIAVNADDDPRLRELLNNGVNPNCTDFTGRTPLHITAFAGSRKCAEILLEYNARMIPRMADGRTVLHICAAHGQAQLLNMFLERSKQNKEESENPTDVDGDGDKEMETGEKMPPDVLDVNTEEWDNCLSPLQAAMMFGQVEAAEILLNFGADPNKGWPLGDVDDYDYEVAPGLSVVMSLAHWRPETCKKLLEVLIKAGCDVARLDQSLRNILHIAAKYGCSEFIMQIMEATPSMKENALDGIALDLKTPLLTAIEMNHEDCVKSLLDTGAKVESTDEACQLARRRSTVIQSTNWSIQQKIRELSEVTPLEMAYPLWEAVVHIERNISTVATALDQLAAEEEAASMGGRDSPTEEKKKDPLGIVKLLIQRGANVNYTSDARLHQTMVDFVKEHLEVLTEQQSEELKTEQDFLAKHEQEESCCSDATSMTDGILTSSQTGLPASYQSNSQVRKLLTPDLDPDSYVIPMLQAKSLEHDAQSLLEDWPQATQPSLDKQIAAYKALLDILKTAGGLEYHELKGTDATDASNKDKRFRRRDDDKESAELTIEKVISRYYLLKDINSTSHSMFHQPSSNQNLGMLLDTRLQPHYHQLFEAVWKGDIEHVEHAMLTGPPEDRLLVCVQNCYGQTPLTLAVLRGHVALVKKLLEIAALQYTPKKEVPNKAPQRGPLETGRLNNFAVEALVDEMGEDEYDEGSGGDFDEDMDEDCDDDMDGDSHDDIEEDYHHVDEEEEEEEESSEDSDIRGVLSEVANMRKDAQRAAQSAAAQQAGVSPDTGTEKVHACHISLETLLSHTGIFPVDLVEGELKEEWRLDIQKFIRSVWKFRFKHDQKAQEVVMKEYGIQLPPSYFGRRFYNSQSRIQAFREASPIELSLLLRRLDILNVLLDACDQWDGQWKNEAIERAKAAGILPTEDEDDQEQGEEGEKTEAGWKDLTKTACELIRYQLHNTSIEDLAIVVDDPSLFACLISRAGGSCPFAQVTSELKSALAEEKKKQTKDVSHTLARRTILHKAVTYGAKKIVEWVLGGKGAEAFEEFLAKKPTSGAAQAAMKLGNLFVENKFTGISSMGSPAAALSSYHCGNLHMQDGKKRSIFHCAVATNSEEMLKFIIDTTESLEMKDTAMAILNTPRIVEKQGSGSSNLLHPKSFSQTSGTTALQAAAFASHFGPFKVLLDAGADVQVPDGIPSRGWNLLAFCVASNVPSSHSFFHDQSEYKGIQMVECLVEHPKVGLKLACEMLSERMGTSKITPFMLAASLGNKKMVEVLRGMLARGVYTSQGLGGATALHLATKTRKLELVMSVLTTEQRRIGLEEGLKEQDVIQLEIAAAAATEDHVGLTPTDISIAVVCEERRKRLKTNRYFDAAGQKDDQHLTTFNKIRDANPVRRRLRPKFEEVQSSALQAAKQVVKNEAENENENVNVHKKDLCINFKDDVSRVLSRTHGY